MAEKQVRLNSVVNDRLEKLIESRKKHGFDYSKQGVVGELILIAYKKEVKK